MIIEPITHLIIDTSSSNEDNNGDCDFCLVRLSRQYVADLLGYMDQVAQMREADDSVYNVECWDATPSYFRFNEKLETIRDIDGDVAIDVPRGEPILLAAAPDFDDDDFQRVECRTVQAACDEVWWTCYVKHTNVRIETAHVSKKTLLKIRQRFPDCKGQPPASKAAAVHPAIQRIHDLLYLDIEDGREFYNPDKSWDADTIAVVAEILAQYISRPCSVESDDR